MNVKEGRWQCDTNTCNFFGIKIVVVYKKKNTTRKTLKGHLVRRLPLVLTQDLQSSWIYVNRLAQLAINKTRQIGLTAVSERKSDVVDKAKFCELSYLA